MPRGDGTGPAGRGWRHWYYATGLSGWQRAPMGPFCPYCGSYGPSPMTQEQERNTLKAQIESFEEVLENLGKRLQELETETKEE